MNRSSLGTLQKIGHCRCCRRRATFNVELRFGQAGNAAGRCMHTSGLTMKSYAQNTVMHLNIDLSEQGLKASECCQKARVQASEQQLSFHLTKQKQR